VNLRLGGRYPRKNRDSPLLRAARYTRFLDNGANITPRAAFMAIVFADMYVPAARAALDIHDGACPDDSAAFIPDKIQRPASDVKAVKLPVQEFRVDPQID
jgi:hypothetical protein